MRLAVTGRDGQIARALQVLGPCVGVTVLPLARPDFDLEMPKTITAGITAARPDVVVNAAAHTGVDKAEAEPERALRINGDAAGHVAAAAARLGVPLIQLSTDYVFDGTAHRPYREDDRPNPLTAYGRSKLAGEQAVASATGNHAILRIAWVFSAGGQNFLLTMLRLARTRDLVRVVADQHGTPSFADDIASGVLKVARNLVDRPEDASLRGIFHMPAAGETTWAGFAEAIMAGAAARGDRAVPVQPIATADYPTPARRPLNSRLDGARLAAVHGLRLPHWKTGLDACLDRLIGPVPAP